MHWGESIGSVTFKLNACIFLMLQAIFPIAYGYMMYIFPWINMHYTDAYQFLDYNWEQWDVTVYYKTLQTSIWKSEIYY